VTDTTPWHRAEKAEAELATARAQYAELERCELIRDGIRERLEAELARQRPVIDAAIAWSQDFPSASKCDRVLMRAVIDYREEGGK
jgi:hypothetical protein